MFSFHFQILKTDSIQLAAQNRVNLIQNQLYKQFIDRVSYELNYQDRPLPQLANFIRDMRRELLEARQLISAQKQEIVQLTTMLSAQQGSLKPNKRVATSQRSSSQRVVPKKRTGTPQKRQLSAKQAEFEQQIESYQMMSQCQQDQLNSQQELIKQLKKDNKELKYYIDEMLKKEAESSIQAKDIKDFMSQSQADKDEIEQLRDQISILQQQIFVYQVQDKIASKVALDSKSEFPTTKKADNQSASTKTPQESQYVQQYKEQTTLMELQNKVRVYGEQIQQQQELIQSKGKQISALQDKLQEVYFRVFEIGKQKLDYIQDKLNHQSCLDYLACIARAIDQAGKATAKVEQQPAKLEERPRTSPKVVPEPRQSAPQPEVKSKAYLGNPDSASQHGRSLEDSDGGLGARSISALSSPQSYADLATLIERYKDLSNGASPEALQQVRQALETAKKTLDSTQYAQLNDQLTQLEHKSAIKEAEQILEEVKSEKEKTPEEPVLLNLAPIIQEQLKDSKFDDTMAKSQTAMSMTQQIDDFIGQREAEEKHTNEINLADPRSILSGNPASNQYEVMFMAHGDAKTEKLSQLLQFNYDLQDTGMDRLQSDINDVVGLGEFSQAVDMIHSVQDGEVSEAINQKHEPETDKAVDVYVDAMCDMTKSLNNTVNQAMRQITGKLDHNIHYE